MWRVVGVRVGLPRHDMEVEGVVVKDERCGLELRVRCCTCHAQAHVPNDEATIVFQEYFNAGCCDMRNLSAPFARP